MSINETVLEMHYHKALLDALRDTLGLGAGAFNFFKYSPQRECFVGFDQAFIQTDLSEEELFQKLKASALNNSYQQPSIFVGYFLQYKVVKQMQKRVRHTPQAITNRLHLRVSLDTTKNSNTGFSQHELLYNLNQNYRAYVYYACPMVFDREELYNLNPDIDLLRLTDISSCPSEYSDNEKHFIYFNDINSTPVWCSVPTEGKAITPRKFSELIGESIRTDEHIESQLRLFDALRKPIEVDGANDNTRLLDLVADSFSIIEFTNQENG